MPATLMGWSRMKASSSAAVAQTGSSSGSSRFFPAMLEPICKPRSPSTRMAWRSSSAASLGACNGTGPMARNLSGRGLGALGSWSGWARGELLVRDAGESGRHCGRLGVEEGLRADRQHLHVDLGGGHVLQPALQVPAPAREVTIDATGDVEGAELVVDVGQLRSDLGRLALQQPDGLFGQNVGVYVDRLRGRWLRGHDGPCS